MNFSESRQNRSRKNREKPKNRFFFPPLLNRNKSVPPDIELTTYVHWVPEEIHDCCTERLAALWITQAPATTTWHYYTEHTSTWHYYYY